MQSQLGAMRTDGVDRRNTLWMNISVGKRSKEKNMSGDQLVYLERFSEFVCVNVTKIVQNIFCKIFTAVNQSAKINKRKLKKIKRLNKICHI